MIKASVVFYSVVICGLVACDGKKNKEENFPRQESSHNSLVSASSELIESIQIELKNNNTIEALILANKLLSLAEKNNDEVLMLEANQLAGDVEYAAKNYGAAARHFFNALDLSIQLKDRKQEAVSLKKIGLVYHFTKLYTDAIASYKASLKIYEEEIRDKDQIARLYRNIGLSYKDNSEFSEALVYFNRSIDIVITLDNPLLLIKSYIDLGTVYDDLDQFDNVIICNRRSLALIELLKNKDGKAKQYEGMLYNNLGFSYIRMNKLEDALKNLYLALKIKQEINDDLSNVFYNLGKVKEKQAKYKLAIDYLNQSLVLYEKSDEFQSMANVEKRLGDIYQKLGLFTLAASYFQKQGEVLQKLNEENKKLAFVEQSNREEVVKAAVDYDFKLKRILAQQQHEKISLFMIFLLAGIVVVFSMAKKIN